MTFQMNPVHAVTLAVALSLAAPVGAQDAQDAQGEAATEAQTAADASTVVARVNGEEITLGHMIALRARLPQQFQQLPDETLFQGILDQLVEQAAIAQAGADEIGLETQLHLENALNEIRANSLLMRAAEEALTEEEVQAAYQESYADAEPAVEYNAAHILVETEEAARDLIAEIEGGADFAELAQEHSMDPGSGAQGGALGWFGAGMMVEPFQEAVEALEPGALSAPVETQFGWHVIRLNETRDAEAPSLEEVREEIEQEIRQQAVLDHIDRVREGAEIELSAEGIDPALLRDQTLLED